MTMAPLGCAASAKADILQINPGKVIQALASSSPKLAHRRPRFQSTRIEAKFKWTVKALAAATVAGTPEAVLPEDVRRATAVLSSASGDDTVYVLGISHVSNESCRHIRELISAVKPDTVLVELCKDRTGLLLDGEGPPPQKWHTGRVRLVGYSPKQGLPSQQELLGLLKATHNAPVSASDIEDDAVALLSTGKPAVWPLNALQIRGWGVKPM